MDLCQQAAPALQRPDGTLTDPQTWQQRLYRWEFDAGAAHGVAVTCLSPVVGEYPRIDERFAMQTTRYTYLACHGGPGTGDPFHRGVACFDAGERVMHDYRFGSTTAVSEPVFVAAASGAAEGEGWLLCIAYDESNDNSRLAVFDAQDLTQGPVAHARVPHRVPLGFHGCWSDHEGPVARCASPYASARQSW
jgi:carotenoid cleavage dioxygenase